MGYIPSVMGKHWRIWPRGLQNSINILKRKTQLWDREELSGAIAVIQVRDNGALDQNHRSGDGRKWTDSQYILEKRASDCVYIWVSKRGNGDHCDDDNFLKVKRIMYKWDNHHSIHMASVSLSQIQSKCINYIKIGVNIGQINLKSLSNMFHTCEETLSSTFCITATCS